MRGVSNAEYFMGLVKFTLMITFIIVDNLSKAKRKGKDKFIYDLLSIKVNFIKIL